MAKAKQKPPVMTLDQQLACHIDKAEEHLIEAVELFSAHRSLERPTGYFTRLVRAQELVTGLNRQELVRIRGPLRGRRRK